MTLVSFKMIAVSLGINCSISLKIAWVIVCVLRSYTKSFALSLGLAGCVAMSDSGRS